MHLQLFFYRGGVGGGGVGGLGGHVAILELQCCFFQNFH